MEYPYIFRTRIRFIDTDASGRIHYTAMFRYFESAEIEFLRTLGISYDVDRSITFPRVHVECDYKLPIVHDDELAIEVRIGHIGNSSVRFDFRTLREGDLAAWGSVSVVCMDRSTQRSAAIPQYIRLKLAEAMGAGE